MRALLIRPDDAELFQNIADPEKYAFLMTHLSAFKRMWTAEGKVYWLRFLLAFKAHFENTFMTRPEYQLLFDSDETEQLQSFVFMTIHKKFVHDSYSAAKTFVDHVFVLARYTTSIREPIRMKNPFYAKESREAFRDLIGKPEMDEDIPSGPITFLCSMYSMFLGSVCALLKRWLKEPDLSEAAKKSVDFTYFYWKPPPEWEDPEFWPSCFQNYLGETYNDALPKMLLTADVHNIFTINHGECLSTIHEKDANIFEILRNAAVDEEDDDDDEPFCMTQVGYLNPYVLECSSHSNCYRKILHDPKCLEPYLCEGSKNCVFTCEKTQKKLKNASKTTNPFKKVITETFTCKLKNKRHVSTNVESHNTQIETFVHHRAEGCQSKIHDEHAEEFMMSMCGDPEALNFFNQHKRKEDLKNRLRSKFHQKYCFDDEDFSDPSHCMSLFEKARKSWLMSTLGEQLCPNSDKYAKLKYGDGSVLNSIESAETTVAVGTHSVLTGRIVLSSPKFCTSRCVCEKVNQEILRVPAPSESEDKPKSKRSKSKKKKKANAKNGGSSTSTSVNETKETTVQVPEVKKVKVPDSVTKKVEISAPLDPVKEKTKNPPSISAEKQQNSQSDKISQKKENVQNKNTSETCGKISPVIVKEPTPVNKSDCDSSQNECTLLNGEINKDTRDRVENNNELCFGDCLTKNTIGHMCSKAVCSMNACCHGCVFVEKKEFTTQTDNSQNGSRVITEKPKKSQKSRVNALENCSTDLNDNAVQTPKDVENSLTALESPTNLINNPVQTLNDDENSKEITTSSSNLNDNAVQTSKHGDNSEETTTFESARMVIDGKAGSGDSITVKSIEETINDKSVECLVTISNTSAQKCLDLINPEEQILIQEHVENDSDLQKADEVIIKPEVSEIATSNDNENVSDTVIMEANAALNNLKFENPEDKIVEDFLTLIGVLDKCSTSEEGMQAVSSSQTTNPECDPDAKDKKLKFKTCAFCGKKEIAYKTFKRCAQCKADNFTVQRYYCSRPCQVDDWQKSHRDEHFKKT